MVVTFLVFLAIGILIVFNFFKAQILINKRQTYCGTDPCNVILIAVDALSARHMSIYGYDRATTPFIEQFFSEKSAVFTNASSNASWTVPSFSSFLTSQYPSEIFMETIYDKLSPGIPTLFDILRSQGFKIAVFSSGLKGRGIIDKPEGIQIYTTRDQLMYLTAGEWIRDYNQSDGKNQPFFLFLHDYTVHSPYDPPEKYRDLFGASGYSGPATNQDIQIINSKKDGPTKEEKEQLIQLYDQEARYLDDRLKDFLGSLPKDILDKTAVVLIADHGEAFGEHKRIIHGSSLYEEQIHVPLLIKVPGLESRPISKPVSLIDLVPTILDFSGIEKPKQFKGRSLVPFLTGDDLPDLVLRSELVPNIEFPSEIKISDFKVRETKLDGKRLVAVRFGRWKLMEKPGSFELYDLESDPGEQNNLIWRWRDFNEKDRDDILRLFGALGRDPV